MKQIDQHLAKTTLDITSISVVAGTLMEVLPPIAALLTISWTLIRIYETKTVQKFLGKKDPD